jgi:hypothetical protein
VVYKNLGACINFPYYTNLVRRILRLENLLDNNPNEITGYAVHVMHFPAQFILSISFDISLSVGHKQ